MKLKYSRSNDSKRKSLWTVIDVAEYLQCSKGHVYNLVWKKGIPYRKIGRKLRFIAFEIENWIEEGSGYER